MQPILCELFYSHHSKSEVAAQPPLQARSFVSTDAQRSKACGPRVHNTGHEERFAGLKVEHAEAEGPVDQHWRHWRRSSLGRSDCSSCRCHGALLVDFDDNVVQDVVHPRRSLRHALELGITRLERTSDAEGFEFAPARPSIVIFPLVVFTFTVEPLMQTPSNVPD